MIDLALLRENPERVHTLIKKKDPSFDIATLYTLDQKVRELRTEIESLRHKKNELADKAKSGITSTIREESIVISKALKEKEQTYEMVQNQFHTLVLTCPNIPLEDVPEGDASHNVVAHTHGSKRIFEWQPKNHLELGTALQWFDFELGAKIAASNFALYKAEATKLLYTLSMYMLKNNIRHGFTPVLPPFLVNETSLTVSGNFPKFKDQAYYMPEDDLYLTPTSEVDLVNIYRDTIIAQEELPIRMTALTSCFRREAGNYGAHERGLIRMHQFEKVELVSLCEPHNSADELDKMVNCAETILKELGLHYRVSLLAGQDTGFQSAKTYDIEVWMPGQNQYREVSSASTCGDFQARRGQIRYKDKQTQKNHFVHTLNASSLALPRVMVALMETYQQEDGSIELPAVLRESVI